MDHSFLGVPIWAKGLQPLVDASMASVNAGSPRKPFVFACANPHSLTVASRDPEFKLALRESDAVVADGVGIRVAATLLRRAMGPRITGIAYFSALMTALNARGAGRVAYFGSSEKVLELLIARAGAAFPNVTTAKAISPPYGAWSAEQNQNFIDEINAAKPDVLWVGMTAPKQEKWVRDNLPKLDCGAIGSIGAVFDYFAGTVIRAPDWVCDMGLEWAYRLSREPRRLWQRTFVSAPQFLGLAMSEALRGRH